MADPHNRPSWDNYFMNIVQEVAKRSTCLRGQTGVVLVRNKRIISTGYNGSAKGLPHCTEAGCDIRITTDNYGKKEERCLRTIHAELNAITQAALHGISTKGATLYGMYKPCSHCMKVIINAGIKRIVVLRNYHDSLADDLARQANLELFILNPDQDHAGNNIKESDQSA